MQKRQRVSQGLEKKEHTQASEGGLKVEAEEGVNWAPEPFAKPWKKRPRGRPWPKGVSGNPAGRPRGSLNKLTLAMLSGIREAEAELAKPRLLDPSRPFESWDGYFWQDGLCFHKDTLEALPYDDPPPVQPQRLDPRERRTEVTWKRRRLYLQNGWAFDPDTWERVKL